MADRYRAMLLHDWVGRVTEAGNEVVSMRVFGPLKKFYRFLFVDSGEDPVQRYEDEILGPMTWEQDDEAWKGQYAGLSYLLHYGYKATPTPARGVCARDIDACRLAEQCLGTSKGGRPSRTPSTRRRNSRAENRICLF